MLCSFTLISGTIYVDWVLSKPTLSVLGVINAGMGVVTGIGLLNFAGMPYNQIVAVMPFLVVGECSFFIICSGAAAWTVWV